MTELLVQLVGGAVGGNVAGGVLKNFSLGPIWNSVVGIVGGGLGGQLLNAVGVMGQQSGGLDIGSILGNVGASGVGGAVLMVIVGLIKNAIAKK